MNGLPRLRGILIQHSVNYMWINRLTMMQCVEKYLKAKLVDAGVEFGKTHDLGVILNLLVRVVPSWEELREDINALAGLAVEVRYPGYLAEAADATEAAKIAFKIRQVVRRSFELAQ